MSESATIGPEEKPLALDLYCGLGGWAEGFIREGWRVIGVDIEDFSNRYPSEFIQADMLTWEGWRVLRPRVIVQSPPCDEFSRWSMPWTRAKNPPIPDLSLWRRGEAIATALGVPLVTENVRGAQQFVGRSVMNCGPFHLWGDVPALVPIFTGKKKESYGGGQRSERAKVPIELSSWVARCFLKSAATVIPHKSSFSVNG